MSPAEKDPEFEQLRQEYHAALGKRAQETQAVLGSLSTNPVEVDGADWTRILYIAHKTAGLAATYDMPHLTDLCAALDDGMLGFKEKQNAQVPGTSFQAWCRLLHEALVYGSQGKDPVHLEIPELRG